MTDSTTAPISAGLYTPEERARRDATIWTPVQGFLAAFQFIVFGISVCLITRYMVTGQGETLAVWSVVKIDSRTALASRGRPASTR